jgi:hypothetical protein
VAGHRRRAQAGQTREQFIREALFRKLEQLEHVIDMQVLEHLRRFNSINERADD